MKTIARSLAFAAALAAALPLAARADGRDDDRWCDDHRPPVHGLPAPEPGHQGWGPGYHAEPGRFRGTGHDWRARELRQIRAQIAALEARRAWFHQRWAGRPGKLRRFDRWYFAERSFLERRYAEIAWVAMR